MRPTIEAKQIEGKASEHKRILTRPIEGTLPRRVREAKTFLSIQAIEQIPPESNEPVTRPLHR